MEASNAVINISEDDKTHEKIINRFLKRNLELGWVFDCAGNWVQKGRAHGCLVGRREIARWRLSLFQN